MLARAAREPEVANRLCQYIDAEQAPPLFMLSTVLLRVVTPFQLRCVIIDFIDTVIPTSSDLQAFLSSSLSPQAAAPTSFDDFLEQETGGAVAPKKVSLWSPTGRDILEIGDALVESGESGVAMQSSASMQKSHERFWFGMQTLSAMIVGNSNVASVGTNLPISIPQEYAQPVIFLDRVLQMFQIFASRVVNQSSADANAAPDTVNRSQSYNYKSARRRYDMGWQGDDGNQMSRDFNDSTSLLAILHLLVVWFDESAIAFGQLLGSAMLLPVLVSLTSIAHVDEEEGRLIEGMASLLLGMALSAPEKLAQAAALAAERRQYTTHESVNIALDPGEFMAMIAARIGIEPFCAALDYPTEIIGFRKAIRAFKGGARAALRPDEFRWYGPHLANAIEHAKFEARQRMVQLYVSSRPPGGIGSLSTDVADHYKDFIKQQDVDLQKFKQENESLRSEVEELALRHLSVGSSALLQKSQAAEAQRDVLQREVEMLSKALAEKSKQVVCLQEESRCTAKVVEKEHHALRVAYNQIEAQLVGGGHDYLGTSGRVLKLEQDLADALALIEAIQKQVPDAQQLVSEMVPGLH